MIGLYGPERLQWGTTGGPVVFQPVYVLERDTMTLAVLFADPDGLATVGNPVWTDQNGEITFYTEIGDYDLWANDTLIAQINVPGPPDGGGLTMEDVDRVTHFEFTVLSPATEWLVDHPLGYDPGGIRCIDSGGNDIFGGVDYPIPNRRVRVSWSDPTAGTIKMS